MALSSGTRIGVYEILGPLGAGGMGEVYRARDTRLGRDVALKILPTTLASDPGLRDRFDREARAIASFTHPHIVTIHSIEEHDGAPFLTMELVEGRTLSELIPSAGLSLQPFLTFAIPLADAVAAAHQRGITHRDLKPGNVMVSTEGRLKVLDFGLAKLKEASPAGGGFTSLPTEQLTGEGKILGTVAYMSPEQAEGKPVDHRSDIFSLGIILYELATGHRPFKGHSNVSVLSAILRDAPPSVADVNAALPRELGRIIRRCLEKDPGRRLQTALDLRNELEDLRTETSGVLPAGSVAVPAGVPRAPASDPTSAVVAPPRRAIPLWAGAVVALLVLGGAGYVVWTGGRQAAPSSDDAAGVTTGQAVTVKAFENRTGDRSLDPVGQMAPDAVVQELPQLDFTQPSRTHAGRPRQARMLATVTGAYYLDGQNLRIQASLSDTAGTVLYSIEPAIGPRSDPGKAVGLARERLLGAIASFLDPGYLPGRLSRPPLYSAYREFVAGMDLFADDPAQAIKHFQRAIELDPDFFFARNVLATVYSNMGNQALRRETLAQIAPMRDRLTPFERFWLAHSINAAERRPIDALKALREAEKLDPENLVTNYQIGFYALRLNRPQETLDEYAKVNAETWNSVTVGGWRYARLTAANHILGRHEEELRIARAAKGLFPSSLQARTDELSALAALGRVDDLRRAVDDALAVSPGGSGTPAESMRAGAEELRTHGRRAESIELAKRAIAWYRNRPPGVQAAEAQRLALAQTLYVAEEWAEAGKLISALLNEQPRNAAYTGLAGATAARLGARDVALKHSAALAGLDVEPDGTIPLRRAQIAAVLGDQQQAVDFLRDAFAQGLPYSMALHRNMDFESLRGFRAFDELMKPKG